MATDATHSGALPMQRAVFATFLVLAGCDLARADGFPPPIELPTFKAGVWTYEITPDGTINRRYVSLNEAEELEVLTDLAQQEEQRRREQFGIEPNVWRVIYALCPETDMVWVDRDGTRYRQVAGMGTDERAWALTSEQQYYDCAYAYSRGNIKIEATDVVMAEPLLGEYCETCFFWPRDWPDLGIALDVDRHDSLIGHYFPGPTRPWARGGTGGQGDWMVHLGHTSVQFAPGRETGGPVSDFCRTTLHEWLHQIAYFPSTKSGYAGLPTQYDPGNLHGGSHLYWMHDMLTPRMWRQVHTQIPTWAPPNKPKDRYAGFVSRWVVAGVFDLPLEAATGDNMIPASNALDIEFIDVESARPAVDEPATADGKIRWKEHKRAWRSEHFETNLTSLRSVFPSPHRDSLAYAHVYVNSPACRDAILWITSGQPFIVWLNGKHVLKCWGGVAEDEASRRVTLAAGWNRLMVKTLDQESHDWWLAARFTSLEHDPLDDLDFSANRPDGAIIASKDAPGVPPIEINHYHWEDVSDDWFGRLPILTEQHFEALFGQEGVRILGPPPVWNGVQLDWYLDQRWTVFDVSDIEGIRSHVISPDCKLPTLENDATLNNVLNLARRTNFAQHYLFYESMALVRYTRPDGSVGDLVLVRPDLVEAFMDLAGYPGAWPGPRHSERLIGFVCRDTKTYFCFDTNLGDPLPVNELDVLRAHDDTLTLSAGADVPRVLRGRPCRLTNALLNTSKRPVPCELVVREHGATEPLARETFELPPGGGKVVAVPLETSGRRSGTLALDSTVTYTDGGQTRTLHKPVLIPVFDTVGVKVRIDGSEVLTTPAQTLVVSVTNNVGGPVGGLVFPEVPEGWSLERAEAPFNLERLDDTQEIRFAMRIPVDQPDGAVWLKTTAKLGHRSGPIGEGGVHVYKRFDSVLLLADFENGIDGDFAFIRDGLYDVQLWRNDPAVGKACLRISDRGGQRFGHVYAYGRHTFKPAEIVPMDAEYTYDTRAYPYVDFWFKMEPESKYDNIGLSVVLDDQEDGYGVLINGVWDQQWAPKVMVGRAAGFEPDGQWHHIAINLDEMLDAYLGDTSHYVKELYLGDTRTLSSGWWPDYRHHAHYLDHFQIRRDPGPPPACADATPSGLRRYTRTHRLPAFESPPVEGLKATLRFDRLGYFPWDEPELQLWLTNLSDRNIRIATCDRGRLWQIRITTEDREPITDGWVNAWSDPDRLFKTGPDGQREPRSPAERGEPHAAEHFKVLKPGESHREDPLSVEDLFAHWAKINNKKLEQGKTYLVTARYVNEHTGEEWGEPAWTGSVDSNQFKLTLFAVPTAEEELLALTTSHDCRRRARAAAQLGKTHHAEAIPALTKVLRRDRDDDVRLNAAWALGEMGRVDPDNAAASQELQLAVDALIEALGDENWRVAEYAGEALGKIGDRRATPALAKRLDNPSKWVRRRTVNALADMADPAAIEPLALCLHDSSREVRREVIRALIDYCDRAIKPVDDLARRCRDLEQDRKDIQELESVRRQLDAAREEFLATYRRAAAVMDDEYCVVRRIWIEASPHYANGVDVLAVVCRALYDSDDDVREAALRVLGELQQRAAQCDELDEFRRRVTSVAPRITELLGDYYTPVREQAVAIFENVTGNSLEEATGRSADDWRRAFPRPGDPRSPCNAYRSSLGD
jgi:HEAT repeat protein